MTSYIDKYFEFEGCHMTFETAGAYNIFIEEYGEEIWIPKSVIAEGSKPLPEDGSECVVGVARWWVNKHMDII